MPWGKDLKIGVVTMMARRSDLCRWNSVLSEKHRNSLICQTRDKVLGIKTESLTVYHKPVPIGRKMTKQKGWAGTQNWILTSSVCWLPKNSIYLRVEGFGKVITIKKNCYQVKTNTFGRCLWSGTTLHILTYSPSS